MEIPQELPAVAGLVEDSPRFAKAFKTLPDPGASGVVEIEVGEHVKSWLHSFQNDLSPISGGDGRGVLAGYEQIEWIVLAPIYPRQSVNGRFHALVG